MLKDRLQEKRIAKSGTEKIKMAATLLYYYLGSGVYFFIQKKCRDNEMPVILHTLVTHMYCIRLYKDYRTHIF